MTTSTPIEINALQTCIGFRGLIGLREMEQPPESKLVSESQPGKPRLLDQVRAVIRGKHYSRRTEKTYIHWIKRYIYFTGKRHPAVLGAPEVTAF